MADGENKSQSFDYSEQRFKYIGFDVFPGKAGDIFKSEDEKKTLIQRVRDRMAKSQGEVRERCTLMASRVSGVEKGFLTVAAIAMVVTLFLPWFSGSIPTSYQEVGDVEGTAFFYSSDTDERLIGFVTNALREKHKRSLRGSVATEGAATEEEAELPGVADEPAEAIEEQSGMTPGDTMVTTGALASDTAVAAATDSGAAELPQDEVTPVQAEEGTPATKGPETSPVLRVVFVNTTIKDSLRTTEDLRRHVIAYYQYDNRTDRESLSYGAEAALAQMPNIVRIAQVNDSLIDARLARIRTEAEEAAKPSRRTTEEQRQAKVDSILADTAGVGARLSVFGEQQITTTEMTVSGIVNDNYSKTGIGVIAGMGGYLGKIFSSGPLLMITGILMILFFVACPVLAAVNFYALYGIKKKDEDSYVLTLKRFFRWNWVPVLIWLAMFLLSFFGAPYGFNTDGMVKQVGDSYGVATFIGLSSMGIYLVLIAFLISALKGKEI